VLPTQEITNLSKKLLVSLKRAAPRLISAPTDEEARRLGGWQKPGMALKVATVCAKMRGPLEAGEGDRNCSLTNEYG